MNAIQPTGRREKCTLRNVQTKTDIPAHAIAMEIVMVVNTFGDSIKEKTGFQMRWHRLDLANVESREEQIRFIKDWGRGGVKAELG